MQRRIRSPRRAIAVALIVGGLICAGLAFGRGFALPFMGSSDEIVVEADSSGELEAVDEVPFSETGRSETAPDGAETTPSDDVAPPTGGAESAAAEPERVALKGTGVSIEVPPGWYLEDGDFDEVIEIRWRNPEVTTGPDEALAYVLLQKSDLRSGEDVEAFAERKTREFVSSATPEQKVTLERDDVITGFHGVTALTIDMVAHGGFLPFHMRNIYWVKDGGGYVLTCYARAGTFKDRQPAFNRMLESLRL